MRSDGKGACAEVLRAPPSEILAYKMDRQTGQTAH